MTMQNPLRLAAAALIATLLTGCVGDGSEANDRAAADANLQLGLAYLRQNNLPVAKDKLERALQQNPRSSQVHSSMALLHERLGDDIKADASYRTALGIAPNDPDVQNNYAVFLCNKGRVGEGVKRFEQAAVNPLYRTPWAAYTNAGVCLRGAGSDGDAAQMFNKALQVRPNYGEAVVQLADLDLAQKRAPAAYQRVEAFLSRNASTPDLLLMGWRAARDAGDVPNADRLARRLQIEYPTSEQAKAVTAARANKG